MKLFLTFLVVCGFAAHLNGQWNIFAGGGGVISLPTNKTFTIGRSYEMYKGVGYSYSAEIGSAYRYKRHTFTLKVGYLRSSMYKEASYHELYGSIHNGLSEHLVNCMGFEINDFIQIPISYGYAIINRPDALISLTPYVGWVNQFNIRRKYIYNSHAYNSSYSNTRTDSDYGDPDQMSKYRYLGAVQLGFHLQIKYLYIDCSDIIRVTNLNDGTSSYHIFNIVMGVEIPLGRKIDEK